jgi:hypothetical protein
MKRLFNPIYAIIINWILFMIYADCFTKFHLLHKFKHMDYNLHEGRYHFGPGLFSLVVTFVFLIFGIIYNHISIKVRKNDDVRYDEFSVNFILVVDFLIQSAIVINHFGLF